MDTMASRRMIVVTLVYSLQTDVHVSEMPEYEQLFVVVEAVLLLKFLQLRFEIKLTKIRKKYTHF